MTDAADRPRKRSVAVVVVEPGGGVGTDRGGSASGADTAAGGRAPGGGRRWLLVQRPLDDEDLPGEWGLPAGTLEPGEMPEALVRRIGRQKLGVALRPGRALASGGVVRPAYTLEMALWSATLESGTIAVPRADRDVTQYRDWAWRPAAALRAGAARGSLCCRLGLEWARERPGSSKSDERGATA